jgi:hypothetical protein
MARGFNTCRVVELPVTIPHGLAPLHRIGAVGAGLAEDLPSFMGGPDEPQSLLYQTYVYRNEAVKIELERREKLQQLRRDLCPRLNRAEQALSKTETELAEKVEELLACRKQARKRLQIDELNVRIKTLRAQVKLEQKEVARLTKRYCAVGKLRALRAKLASSEQLLEADDSRDKLVISVGKLREQLSEQQRLVDELPAKVRRTSTKIADSSVEVEQWTLAEYRALYAGSPLYGLCKGAIAEYVKSSRGKAPPKTYPYRGTGAFVVQLQKRTSGYRTVTDLFSGREINGCVQIVKVDPSEVIRQSMRGKPIWVDTPELRSPKREMRRVEKTRQVKAGLRTYSDEHVTVLNGKKAYNTYRLRLRVGSGKNDWVEVPFAVPDMSRLPGHAQVRFITLRRKEFKADKRWYVQLTLADNHGAFQRETGPGTVGIDLGWRQVKSGLRVAYWSGSDGRHGQLVLPQYLLRRWDKCHGLQSTMSTNLDSIKARLLAWLKAHKAQVPNWLKQATKHLAQLRSGKKLGRLVYRWKEQRFAGDGEIFQAMEAWRRQNRHLWQWWISQSRRTLLQRKDIYLQFAAQLRRDYGTVYLEDLDLRSFARHGLPEDEGEAEEVRRLRYNACLSELRGALQMSGMQVEKRQAAYSTDVCHLCGSVQMVGKRLQHRCTSCGEHWDQDFNAAHNLRTGEHERAVAVASG